MRNDLIKKLQRLAEERGKLTKLLDSITDVDARNAFKKESTGKKPLFTELRINFKGYIIANFTDVLEWTEIQPILKEAIEKKVKENANDMKMTYIAIPGEDDDEQNVE